MTYQLRSVGEETADLLRTTQHVDRNISEAQRRRNAKVDSVNNKERTWMDDIIHDTREALLDVARLIEPARVDTELRDSVNAKNKLMWVLRDGPKVRDKHKRLSICHQSLMTVINTLHAKDRSPLISPLQEEIDEPPPYEADMQALFRWKCRRKRRASTSNVTMSGDASSISSDPMPRHCRTSVDTFASTETPPSASTLDSFSKLTLQPFTTFNPSMDTLDEPLYREKSAPPVLHAFGGPDLFLAKSEFDDSPIAMQEDLGSVDAERGCRGVGGEEVDTMGGEARLRRGSRATRHWRRDVLSFYAKNDVMMGEGRGMGC